MEVLFRRQAGCCSCLVFVFRACRRLFICVEQGDGRRSYSVHGCICVLREFINARGAQTPTSATFAITCEFLLCAFSVTTANISIVSSSLFVCSFVCLSRVKLYQYRNIACKGYKSNNNKHDNEAAAAQCNGSRVC